MVAEMTKSDFLTEARARGFVFQCTDEEALDGAFLAGRVSGYTGFDLTADCLHVGSMVQIMLLRLMQKHGHRPVLLLGGGTTKIGDPSGKEEARQMLTPERIAENGRGILGVLQRFVRLGEGETDALIVDNAEWLDRLGYIELLRDVGPHVSLSRMLSFDSVKLRLEREQGLSFLEFNYSILQSYDFRELNRRHGIVLQMGGSDQWGNIVSGVELARRTDRTQLFGLTTPLIATASGAKMGKSASGAIWLSADRVSPFDYWQFWRNTEDADVGRFLKLFTDLPVAECDRLGALQGAEINEAKKVLATEATALCHGRDVAEQVAETARQQFEGGGAAAGALPVHLVSAEALLEGIPLVRLMAEAGLVASNGEARRLIRGGGARVNDVVVADEARVVTASELAEGGVKLSAGRKQHVVVRTD
ncbi:tyrosine--tRNA ligase [Acetobacteraceae bacterium KSS8]|uniref:Tyrosine--tRNA ligase n=1 Tax=Endosaccharibacter trunci TaxID=2812733 RepID=A0ABT1WB03_9PROT|nr:tyrosine--tRNA ligase [Acetobacteraceae bacterium KSS8]